MKPLADGEWHHMHPATPLLRGGLALVAVVGVIIANLRERIVDWLFHVPGQLQQGDPVDAIVQHGWTLWALLGALLFIVLIIVFYRISWQATEFRVTKDAVELRSGVLNKQNRQARLDRIQGINVHRTLFARLFGAARLEIIVAGHDANLSLQYLGSAPAEELRREVLGLAHPPARSSAYPGGHPSAQPPGAPAYQPGLVGGPGQAGQPGQPDQPAQFSQPGQPGQPDYPDQPAQAAQAGAPGSPGFAPAGALDALLRDRAEELVNPADLHPDWAPPESVVKVHPGRLVGSIVLSPITIVLAAVIVWLVIEASRGSYILIVAIVPSLFGMITGYSRRFSRLARYTISGSSDGVRVGYGLLGTSSETIPTGRIHAVELVQPLLWRPFGWWAIRINRAGRAKQRGQAENASTVLPVGSVADVERVLPLLVPAVDAEALRGLTEASVRRIPRDAASVFSRAPRSAAWLHPFSWRRIGYAYAGDTIALREGVVDRRLVLVPLARVQSVALRQGPLHRMLGLAAVTVHVVDGRIRPVLRVIGTAAGAALFDQLAASAVALASRDVRS